MIDQTYASIESDYSREIFCKENFDVEIAFHNYKLLREGGVDSVEAVLSVIFVVIFVKRTCDVEKTEEDVDNAVTNGSVAMI